MQLVAILWILMLAAVSVSNVLGAIVPDAKVAIEMAPVVFVPQILFLGFFVNISQIPVWLSWAQYLCMTKYALDAALLVEFNPALCTDPYNQDTCVVWAATLTNNSVYADQTWFYWFLLVVLFVGFRLAALMILSVKASNFET